MTAAADPQRPQLLRTQQSLYGIARVIELPDEEFGGLWEHIYTENGLKERLKSYASLVTNHQSKRWTVPLALHRISLLGGPPGTGKTSLARGVANKIAEEAPAGSSILYGEIDSAGLMSGILGESPKHIARVFRTSIVELAKTCDALFLLFDEIEDLGVTRGGTSLETNPVDVHRATNALLTGLDGLAERVHNVCILATSNHLDAVDDALLSRVDLTFDFHHPSSDARRMILLDALRSLNGDGPCASQDCEDLEEVVAATEGRSGRELRKLVLEAIVAVTTDRGAPEFPLRAETIMSVLAMEGSESARRSQ